MRITFEKNCITNLHNLRKQKIKRYAKCMTQNRKVRREKKVNENVSCSQMEDEPIKHKISLFL